MAEKLLQHQPLPSRRGEESLDPVYRRPNVPSGEQSWLPRPSGELGRTRSTIIQTPGRSYLAPIHPPTTDHTNSGVLLTLIARGLGGGMDAVGTGHTQQHRHALQKKDQRANHRSVAAAPKGSLDASSHWPRCAPTTEEPARDSP